MRTPTACIAVALLPFVLLPVASHAGTLDPPGPPAPTMKTLAEAEPRLPISSLPFTINTPGSYYFTANLTASGSSNGITVNASSVTIDLNGFTLDGAGTGNEGIRLVPTVGTGHYTIRNGTVANWYYNVRQAAPGPDLSMQDVGIRSARYRGVEAFDVSVTRCPILFSADLGMHTGGVAHVRESRIAGNNGGGVHLAGPRNLVESCTVDDNGNFNIRVGSFSVVRHCVVESSWASTGPELGTGIYMEGLSRAEGNTVTRNANIGIYAGNGTDVVDNTIQYSPVGIRALQGTHAEGNILYNNDTSVVVPFGSVILLRNVSHGAGVGYSLAGSANVAPIDTTGTSTNPWVNFQF